MVCVTALMSGCKKGSENGSEKPEEPSADSVERRALVKKLHAGEKFSDEDLEVVYARCKKDPNCKGTDEELEELLELLHEESKLEQEEQNSKVRKRRGEIEVRGTELTEKTGFSLIKAPRK